jgi:hypothetical protein
VYDDLTFESADDLFDDIMLYNDVHLGAKTEDFAHAKTASDIFVIVQTFHEEDAHQKDEFIAHVEGVVYPFFGFSYRLDQI